MFTRHWLTDPIFLEKLAFQSVYESLFTVWTLTGTGHISFNTLITLCYMTIVRMCWTAAMKITLEKFYGGQIFEFSYYHSNGGTFLNLKQIADFCTNPHNIWYYMSCQFPASDNLQYSYICHVLVVHPAEMFEPKCCFTWAI